MNKNAEIRLAQLLDEERDALLNGDLVHVAALIDEKEALAAGFTATKSTELRHVSSALARNAALIAAARDGVSAVMDTLNRQRAARMTLSTYDKSGKPATISQQGRGTERRF